MILRDVWWTCFEHNQQHRFRHVCHHFNEANKVTPLFSDNSNEQTWAWRHMQNLVDLEYPSKDALKQVYSVQKGRWKHMSSMQYIKYMLIRRLRFYSYKSSFPVQYNVMSRQNDDKHSSYGIYKMIKELRNTESFKQRSVENSIHSENIAKYAGNVVEQVNKFANLVQQPTLMYIPIDLIHDVSNDKDAEKIGIPIGGLYRNGNILMIRIK